MFQREGLDGSWARGGAEHFAGGLQEASGEWGRSKCGGERLGLFGHRGEVEFGSDVGCSFLCGDSGSRCMSAAAISVSPILPWGVSRAGVYIVFPVDASTVAFCILSVRVPGGMTCPFVP